VTLLAWIGLVTAQYLRSRFGAGSVRGTQHVGGPT
jgi:hypothetical protein